MTTKSSRRRTAKGSKRALSPQMAGALRAAEVVGIARGIDVDAAIADAIRRSGVDMRPYWYQVLDLAVHDAGGFTGAKVTRVAVRIFPG